MTTKATKNRNAQDRFMRLQLEEKMTWEACHESPEHATIAAAEMGLVKVGIIALDSTRMKADASPGANHNDCSGFVSPSFALQRRGRRFEPVTAHQNLA